MKKFLLFLLWGILSCIFFACEKDRILTPDEPLTNEDTIITEEETTDTEENASSEEVTADAEENAASEEVTAAVQEDASAGIEDEVIQAEPVFTERTALEFVKDMGIGWNLGNTLDPVDCTWLAEGDQLGYETAWGNVKTTQQLIKYIKSEGFDTVRIPVTWTNHVGEAPDYKVNDLWMNRVQEIVDWCMEEDMYVIINMHHDKDWITKASTDYDTMITKYRAIWSQIVERFGDYSENLVFESMNEIGFDDLGTEKGAELVNKINGEFVQLVRSSGKHNEDRFLLLAGYWTDIDRSVGRITNQSDDRAIISVHYYSPAQFAIADATSTWGYQETWGTEADITYLKQQMDKLKTAYLDKGIAVILGEFGCLIKDKDMQSRILYLSSVTKYAREYGICPVLWDNGQEINRTTLIWNTAGLSDAIRNVK